MVARNDPPDLSSPCWFHNVACQTTLPANHPYDGEPKLYLSLSDDAADPKGTTTCSAVSIGGTTRGCDVIQCRNVGGPASMQKVIELSTLGSGRTCTLDVTITDEWSTSTLRTFSVPVR